MGYREKSLLSFYTPFAFWYRQNDVTPKHLNLDFDTQPGNANSHTGRRKHAMLQVRAIFPAPVLLVGHPVC